LVYVGAAQFKVFVDIDCSRSITLGELGARLAQNRDNVRDYRASVVEYSHE